MLLDLKLRSLRAYSSRTKHHNWQHWGARSLPCTSTLGSHFHRARRSMSGHPPSPRTPHPARTHCTHLLRPRVRGHLSTCLCPFRPHNMALRTVMRSCTYAAVRSCPKPEESPQSRHGHNHAGNVSSRRERGRARNQYSVVPLLMTPDIPYATVASRHVTNKVQNIYPTAARGVRPEERTA